MKKRSFNPGFEFIFSLSILAILGLPPLVSAQSQKDLQITITNGDTVVNGKNIKDLDGKQRKQALRDISQIAVINSGNDNGPHKLVIVKRSSGDSSSTTATMGQPTGEPMAMNGKHFKHQRLNDSARLANGPILDGPRKHWKGQVEFHGNHMEENPMMGFNHRNTQNFVYNNIDNDGISTRVSFHVSDHTAMLDHDASAPAEKPQMDMLTLNDLNLVPELSSGKIMLMFNLPSKAVAEVKFKDSNDNLLWTERAVNGTFSKPFSMGLNGIYYLQVKQAGKVAVKKIMKD